MNGKMDSAGKVKYISVITLFIIFGGVIGAATYVSFIPQTTRTSLKFSVAIVSLVAWLLFSQNERLQEYKQIPISFFAISLGVLLVDYFGNLPMQALGVTVTTVKGVAIAKFSEAFPIILSILVIHFVTGGDMNGLFLRGGNLRLGLTVGIIGAVAFIAFGFLQVNGSGLKFATVLKELPWILTFVFFNAFMEELWFRALFLKKLELLAGGKTALVITSLVFAGVHISSTYVIDIIVFIVLLLVLGLLWGWLMQKSDSIWGSVLFHAGADVVVILGFLAGVKV